VNKSIDPRNILILSDIYDLNATSIDELEHFDLSAVTQYTSYPDTYTMKNYGKFDMQQFQVGPDELYNLIICEDDFTNSERLFEAMQDEERRSVKEYELVDQKKTLSGYFLYRLVPYTIQGKPTWY
jgi:hypothetical protein